MIIIDLGKPGIEKNKTTVPQIILKIITILEIKKIVLRSTYLTTIL